MAFEELKDRQWVEVQLGEGKSSADIARHLGCSPALVCRWLKQHGIQSSRAELKEKLNDREWLERVYVVEERNAAQVAGILGCDRSAVHDALRRHGLPIKGRSQAQVVKTEHLGSRAPRPRTKFLDTLSNKEWLEARLAEGLSVSKMAQLAGAAPPSVSIALEKFDLEPNLPPMRTSFVQPRMYKVRKVRNPDARQRHWYRARRTTPVGSCVVCRRPGLDVNHKDRNPENNDPSNLERLCRRCHRRQESCELAVMKARLESLGVRFVEIHEEARKALTTSLGL